VNDARPQGTLRAMLLIAAVIVPAFLVGAWGYRTYIRSRAEYLTRLDYRELRVAADQLRSQMEGMLSAWKASTLTKEDAPIQASEAPATEGTGDLFVTETDGTTYFYVRGTRPDGGIAWGRKALSDIIHDLGVDERRFDEILLLTEGGWVVYGRTLTNLAIADLIPAPAERDKQGTGKSAPTPGTGLNAGRVTTLVWNNAPHRLFVQPTGIRLRFQQPGGFATQEVALVIGGLVSEDRFDHESRRIPYRWGVAAIVLLLLGLLAWPLLGVRLLGQRERLSTMDVRIIAGALFVLFGVWPALFLAAYGSTEFEVRSDAQLPQIAEQLQNRFKNRLDHVLEVMLQADRRGDAVAWQGIRSAKEVVRLSVISPIGLIEHTWEVTSDREPKELPNANINVADRDYFKAIQRGAAWECRPDTRCAIEVVRAKRQATFRLMVAMPAADHRVIIGNVGIEPFERPLLPPDVGFAIIDDSGKVQLNSNGGRNLVENFFDAVDASDELRAAVATQNQTEVTTTYAGEETSIRLQWLPASKWTLLVFRSLRSSQVVAVETMARWVVAFGLYALLALACALAWEALSRPFPLPWLWPNRNVPIARYAVVCIRMALLAGILQAMFDHLPSPERLLVLIVVPLLAVASAARDLAQDESNIERFGRVAIGLFASAVALAFFGRPYGLAAVACHLFPARTLVALSAPSAPVRERWFRAGYVASIAAILFITSALPAKLLFDDARAEVEAEYAEAVQNVFDRATDHGEAAYWNLATSEPEVTAGDTAAEPPVPGRLSAWVAGLLPMHSNGVAEMRQARGPLPASSGRLRKETLALVTLIALAAGVLTLAALIARLFHLDADALDGPDADLATQTGTASVFIFRFRHDATRPRGEDEDPQTLAIDLRRGSGPESLEKRWSASASPSRVELHHVEARLHDLDWQQAILTVLEAIVFDPTRSLVVTSTVEPYHYLRARAAGPGHASGATGKETAHPADARALLPRWSLVLSALSKERHDLPLTTVDPGLKRMLERHGFLATDTTAETMEARYRETWRTLTRDERLALRQLADEGFVSPAALPTVRLLMRRRLVQRKPMLQLVPDGFRRFVLGVEDRETISRWEHATQRSGLEMAARLLPGVLFGGLVFVFATQRAVFDATTTIVGAAGTALPLLLRVLGNLGGQRPANAADAEH
jgi:hypothetical protein